MLVGAFEALDNEYGTSLLATLDSRLMPRQKAVVAPVCAGSSSHASLTRASMGARLHEGKLRGGQGQADDLGSGHLARTSSVSMQCAEVQRLACVSTTCNCTDAAATEAKPLNAQSGKEMPGQNSAAVAEAGHAAISHNVDAHGRLAHGQSSGNLSVAPAGAHDAILGPTIPGAKRHMQTDVSTNDP